MKFIQFLFPAFILLSLNMYAQDTLRYDKCDCIDLVDDLEPMLNGSYQRICGGQIIEKGQFKEGLKIGEWTSYSETGKLIKNIHYSNGILHGEVSYFYNNGKKKLYGNFINGQKNGTWIFFNQKEKQQWTLNYEKGIPVGKSLIYDQKGKKVRISYDFDKNLYVVNTPNFSLFKEKPAVLQDANSSGWFILFFAEPTAKMREMNLNLSNVESELFLNLMEIPSEYFNSYVTINYNVQLTFENNGLKSVEMNRDVPISQENPVFSFAVMTNDPENLYDFEPTEFSLKMLDSKIKEALTIFTPWQIRDGELKFVFLYVINEIDGRSEIDKL